MKAAAQPWRIIGQGLAGTCLAWHFLDRATECIIVSDGKDGSSRVAAGLVNPVTGKNFAPSWRLSDFLPEADDFYRKIESLLGLRFWHRLPVIRLARDAKEWQRIEERLARPETFPWIVGTIAPPAGWYAAVELRGGARLDCRAFLDASLVHFERLGIVQHQTFERTTVETTATPAERMIRCEGAAGLLTNQLGPHRSAKGEILTIEAPDWSQAHIRVGGGGWLVPIGANRFKAGSTYDWNALDAVPTPEGHRRILELASALGDDDHYAVVAHEAGVRPILRRSQPIIGHHPQGGWVFNGLGSKGSLYAPGCAQRLADACLDAKPIDEDLDFHTFTNSRT